MFRGIHHIALDAKGRLALPTRYRDRIQDECGGQLILTVDLYESCLQLYRLPDWERIEAQLDALPSLNALHVTVRRKLLNNASEVELDSAGRVLVPPALRRVAGLDKEVVLAGQGKKFELWSDGNWAGYCERADKQLQEELLAAEGGKPLSDELSRLVL